MADLCGECLKLDWDNKSSYGEKYFCRELSKYVSPSDRGCRYYSYNPGHNNKKDNDGWKPSGFSWSEVLRKLGESLGLSNDSSFIESMQYFKENILGNDELFEYCKNIIDNLFVPMFEFIQTENLEEAKLTFHNFVDELKTTMGFILTAEKNRTPILKEELVRKRVLTNPSEA